MNTAIISDTILTLASSLEIPVTKSQSVTVRYYDCHVCSPELILPAVFNTTESCFFYVAPDDAYSFVAAGLKPAPAEFNPAFFLQQIKVISNQVKEGHKELPLLFSRKFFNIEPSDTLWSDFTAEWMIPEYLIYTANGHSLLLTIDNNAGFPVFLTQECTDNSTEYFARNHIFSKDISFQAGCSFDEFESCIHEIQNAIQSGAITKAVFSRMQFAHQVPADFSVFLKNLHKYPLTHRFLFKSRNSVFAGASPELLLTLQGNNLATEALAGTAARGNSQLDDAELSSHLLADEKELLEHKIVTEYITGILGQFTGRISFSPLPGIKKLTSLQHLWTPIQAELDEPEKIFAIIDALFPTPATCGYPRKESYQLISELEHYSRGLYCGAITWTNINGDVDSFIPLRSALFKNNSVYLFSGGGIVAASDAKAEFEESLKKADSIKALFFQ